MDYQLHIVNKNNIRFDKMVSVSDFNRVFFVPIFGSIVRRTSMEVYGDT